MIFGFRSEEERVKWTTFNLPREREGSVESRRASVETLASNDGSGEEVSIANPALRKSNKSHLRAPSGAEGFSLAPIYGSEEDAADDGQQEEKAGATAAEDEEKQQREEEKQKRAKVKQRIELSRWKTKAIWS